MTSEELYLECKILLNKNGKNTNIDIPKANFVILFNREQERWLYQSINKKKDSNDIHDIQKAMVYDLPIVLNKSFSNYNTYDLPKDLFKFLTIKVNVNKESCTKFINARPVKIKYINELLIDEFNKPSLEWEETIFTLGDSQIQIYFTDFQIKDVLITYYKKLKEIDLIGYIKLDKSISTNQDSELDSVYLRQILDRVVKEVNREFENPEGFQYSLERVSTEEQEKY